jgi:hypothetical protein
MNHLTKTVIVSGIRTLPPTLNKTVLHQKYVLEGCSLRQIAHEISSSKTGVRQALIRFGIPLRGQGKNPRRTHAVRFGMRVVKGSVVDYVGELRTIDSILRMKCEGLSNCAIARVLTEMRIPTKQRGQRWHPETVRQILLKHRSG